MNDNLIKTIYFHIICLVSLLIILWGSIDTSSALISIVSQRNIKTSSEAEKSPDYAYALDRLFDGSLRIILPGFIFLYFSKKIRNSNHEKEKSQ